MDYAIGKMVHQGAAAVSVVGFVARGLGALAGASWVRSRAAKTLPHLVDMVLLAAALSLVWMHHLTVLQEAWLMAKLAGLLAYIGLGAVALRPGSSTRARMLALGGALLTVAWIVSVAFTKSAWGFLGPVAGP